MKYKVRFAVTYEVEITCKKSDLEAEVSNWNIPEDDQTRYVQDTFEVVSIRDSKGKEVFKRVEF